jgi:hypothetical protein
MRPPADVPRAPSKSPDDSTTIPLATIAARNAAVLLPGSPDASAASGNGSPSVDAMSYLGIPQSGHAAAAFAARPGSCWVTERLRDKVGLGPEGDQQGTRAIELDAGGARPLLVGRGGTPAAEVGRVVAAPGSPGGHLGGYAGRQPARLFKTMVSRQGDQFLSWLTCRLCPSS